MGYDTNLVIGELSLERPEYVLDMENPYEDGSGYPRKMDEDGKPIPTGRMKRSIMVAATLELCCIPNSKVSALHDKAKKAARKDKKNFIFMYESDGNNEMSTDAYGDPLVAVPFQEVLKALRVDMQDPEQGEYRRFKWMLGLMEAMDGNADEMVCVFYGS